MQLKSLLRYRWRARACTIAASLSAGFLWLGVMGPFAQGGPAKPAVPSLVRGVPSEAQRVTLAGSVHSLAQERFDAGAVPDSFPMAELKLVLRRSPEQEAALQRLLTAQQTPGSAQYHRWLTPAQFGTRFGASDQDLQVAKAWLQKHAFDVGEVPAGRGLLPFSGTAAQVAAAFQTPIHYFVVDGVEHFANTANPQIPGAFQALVSGIRGLNDFRARPGAQARLVATPAFSFGNGQNLVAPADYAVIYDFVPLYKGNITGTGVTVAVAAQSDIDLKIPATFWSAYGVNQGQQVSSVAAAAATDPGRTNDGDETEAYLDVEIVGGLAPGAKIVVVRDKDVTTAFDYAIDHNLAAVVNISFSSCESDIGGGNVSISSAFQQAAAQGITVAVSSGDSGIAECDDGIGGKKGDTVVSGLSVNGLASTPYNIAVGGTDFNPILVQAGDYWNAANSPGTYANAKSYIPEMVWNLSCVNPVTAAVDGATSAETFCNDSAYAALDLIEGGGGGVSSCINVANSGACASGYPQPSWQSGVGGLSGLTNRAVPDVAMLANDLVACDQKITVCGPSSTQVEIFSGTSAAAPAMSAIVALLDQALISKNSADGRQGNLNPTLYSLAALEYGSTQSPNSANLTRCNANQGGNVGATCVFNDVTTGSNGQPCSVSKFAAGHSLPASICASASGDAYGVVELSSNSAIPYSAGAAYDLSSGLGSINAANLIQAIAGLQAPAGLNAAANGTTVNLTWTADSEATSYNLYQGTASGGESTTPAQSGITGTATTVTGLQAGQTYYFFLTAVTASGKSLPSDEANVTLPPAAPTGLATIGTAAKITLTWTASFGASSYSVFQGSKAGGEATTPAATGITTPTYTVAATAGTADYFKVVAVNDGGSSPASGEVSGTVLPAAPSGLTAAGGNASVALSWAPGAGASSYEVFEASASGKEGSTPVLTNVTGTSAAVTGLAATTTYYFTVTSVNPAGMSAPSNEASGITAAPSSSGGGSLGLIDLLLAGVLLLGGYARKCSLSCARRLR